MTAWLHPDGWANARRDWNRFPEALRAMRDRLAYVPVPGLGSVAMLLPSVIPLHRDDPLVEFTVRIPRAAARGARVEWPRLCRYGTESSALYRAYLSTMAHLDQASHRGHAITADIGAPLLSPSGEPRRRKSGELVRSAHDTTPNPSARFVRPLTDADLTRMIGFDPANKRRRYDARKAFERLDADGVIDLPRARGGVRLFGPREPKKSPQ